MPSIDKLKILHVTWSGNHAGSLCDIIQVQAASDDVIVEVAFGTALDGRHAQKILNLGIPTHDLKIKQKYNLFHNFNGYLRLKKILQERDYNIIHFHDVMLPFVLTAPKHSNGKLKIMVYDHGEFVPFYENFVKKILSNIKKIFYKILVNKYADLVIANSTLTYKNNIELGIVSNRVRVLPNGTDVKSLKKMTNDKIGTKENLIKELNLGKNSVLVGTAARLVALKRLDLLFEAFARLEATNKNLIIMGEGEKAPYLKNLARTLAISQHTYFLGFRNDAKNILSTMDAVVLPSKGESFGLVALESVIMRVPVFIMQDGGGLLDFIKDGENGFICSGPEELTIKLNNFINKKITLKTNEEFYNRLINQSDMDNHCIKLRNFYCELVADNKIV